MRTQATILIAFLIAGCSKGAPASQATQPPVPTPTAPKTAVADPTVPAAPPPTPDPTATSEDEGTVEINLATVGENMAYDSTTLKVQTGKRVHLTLKNNGHSDLMPHNWVLVSQGTQAQVALEGVDKKADGYIVEGPNVLAHTPLAPPQKTAEVTFVAPAPGEYPYICTVPGHYMLMKGTLTVTP
jgi:azurin